MARGRATAPLPLAPAVPAVWGSFFCSGLWAAAPNRCLCYFRTTSFRNLEDLRKKAIALSV